jgi:hypothetical protein
MPYYIDLECSACHSKFKIDAANYANKKISFSCKNCGNKISYFVPPAIQGLSAPKAEISTKKVKKVKEENKKEKNENLNTVKSASSMTTDKLKLKLPSLFKRKNEVDQQVEKPAETPDMGYVINPPVSKIAAESKKQSHQTTRKIPSESGVKNVEKEARPFPVTGPSEERILTQNGSRKPLDFLPRDAGKALPSEAESADFQPVKPRMNVRVSATKPALNNDREKSMVHVPKPGMPFIAQLSTPSFYKAGSARRKDYSFIVTEISRFRTALGRTGMPDPLSTYEMADVSANDQDFTEPEFTLVNESATATPFVIERQPEFPGPPTPPLVYTQPTSAEIEEEAIEFERNIQDEIKHGLPPRIEEEDREMEFVTPISPKESPAAVKPSIPTNNSKIYIPLSRDINPDPERSSGVAGRGSAVAAINNLGNENLITPEIEVIEDSYTSGVPPAPGQPGFQMKIPQIRTPFVGYEQRPLTDSRTLPLNGVGVAPQPYPVGGQQGFSAPVAIPSYTPLQQPYQQTPSIPQYMGQERDMSQKPQTPFYNQQPGVVPQQPFAAPHQAGEETPPPPFLRENAPYQNIETLNQPQSYERPERLENAEVPPYMQHQTATQRIPVYPQGQGNVQQGGINSFPPMNVNTMPAQTSGQSYAPQPDFQGFGAPQTSQQAGMQQSKPMPAVPSAPVQQPQGPFAQIPPEPIPPPSVTSPPPTGTQKKPAIIDEDEEEQFGPSNFGLDF